jgi:hypothetical protein
VPRDDASKNKSRGGFSVMQMITLRLPLRFAQCPLRAMAQGDLITDVTQEVTARSPTLPSPNPPTIGDIWGGRIDERQVTA